MKKLKYRGKYISLFLYKKGGKTIEFIKIPNAVVIIPLIENNKVILVKQYRFPIKRYLWELPAGKVENKESILKAAKRELLEETGYIGKIKKIGSFFVSPAFSNEIFHFFLAYDLKKVSDFNEKEIKEIKIFEIEKLKNSKDLKTYLAYYLIKNLSIIR
ncbi:MAG: NUDIX hydrolase [Candidatus Aenigmatarchaeota archaeon]